MPQKIYLDKEKGKFLGVCAGFARYFDTSVWFIRLLFIIALFSVFPVAFLGYFLLAFLLKKPPLVAMPVSNEPLTAEQVKQTLNAVAQQLVLVEQHIALMENYVISDDFNLQRKLWEL
jgi:phage shock protein C